MTDKRADWATTSTIHATVIASLEHCKRAGGPARVKAIHPLFYQQWLILKDMEPVVARLGALQLQYSASDETQRQKLSGKIDNLQVKLDALGERLFQFQAADGLGGSA